jgi:hypothetical protein
MLTMFELIHQREAVCHRALQKSDVAFLPVQSHPEDELWVLWDDIVEFASINGFVPLNKVPSVTCY